MPIKYSSLPGTADQPCVTAPAVSICVPTYNGKKHLSECINSIIAQSFKNFEVLICDDQSSDGTLDYARELAKGDERFRFILNSRRFGLVGNWNNCVQQARGDWIKFVFQDDVISPSCVEKLLAACQREDKLFGFCERDFIFEDGVSETHREWLAKHQQSLRSEYGASPVVSAEQTTRLAANDPSYNPVGEPTVTLISKKLFQKVGGFDESLIQLCDAEFWYRVMINYGAVFIPERLASFRIHSEAATARNLAKREFRLMMLDPLVMRYKFTFKQDFKSPRNPQLMPKNVGALRWDCMNAAAYVWSQAKNSKKSGDDSLLKEWMTIKSYYPGLHAIACAGAAVGFLRRIKNGIKRRILRRKN